MIDGNLKSVEKKMKKGKVVFLVISLLGYWDRADYRAFLIACLV